MTRSAYTRNSYKGNVSYTDTLASGINNSQTTITLASGTTFPTATFVITVDPGSSTEEKMFVTSRSGATLTISDRGYDGTTASAHSSGVTVIHSISAVDLDEANYTVSKTVGAVTTAGDTLVADGANSFKRLALGSAYQNMQVNSAGTDVTYGTSLASLLTTQGDLPYASSANTPARLAKGTANQALTMNSGATAPQWSASLQSLLTAAGDIIYASGANTPARLAKGTDGQVLTLASGLPSWAAASGGGVPANGTATVATLESTGSTSFTDLTTAGPAVTVTTGTKALVTVTAHMQHDTINAFARMSYAISGASSVAAAQATCLELRAGSVANEVQNQVSATYLVTGLTAGSNTFTAKYFSSTAAGLAYFQYRNIAVIDMGS